MDNMYEQKSSSVAFVKLIWRAFVSQKGDYDDPAKDSWGLGFTKRADGSFSAEILGQSFSHKMLDSHVGDHYWGIEFYPYVTIKGVDKTEIAGQLLSLEVKDNYFYLGEDAYIIPNFEELEAFCIDLEKQGVLSNITPPVFSQSEKFSLRSKQRNHRKIVGLTHKQVEQIRRAEKAEKLLRKGVAPAEVAIEAGYADQAHMSRSLKALFGKTPSKIRKKE